MRVNFRRIALVSTFCQPSISMSPASPNANFRHVRLDLTGVCLASRDAVSRQLDITAVAVLNSERVRRYETVRLWQQDLPSHERRCPWPRHLRCPPVSAKIADAFTNRRPPRITTLPLGAPLASICAFSISILPRREKPARLVFSMPSGTSPGEATLASWILPDGAESVGMNLSIHPLW